MASDGSDGIAQVSELIRNGPAIIGGLIGAGDVRLDPNVRNSARLKCNSDIIRGPT